MSGWTDHEVETILAMLKRGKTAGEIARKLPGRSRNAVIGKVTRDERLNVIGLPGKAKPRAKVKAQPAPQPKPAPAPALKPKPKPNYAIAPIHSKASRPPTPLSVPVEARYYDAAAMHLRLEDLRGHQCRWPVNDAQRGEPHLFCGHRSVDGSSYCAHHKARAAGHSSYEPAREDDAA